MRPVVLFIACSLDGYIARADHGIDWLFTDSDYGYQDFFAGVDTLLMGRKTFEASLAFGDDVYEGREAFVFTRTARVPHGTFTFVTDDIAAFVTGLKHKHGRTVWLVGGAQITAEMLRHDLIDEFRLFVHPILLGSGIPLFSGRIPETRLKFAGAKNFDTGLVELNYRRQAGSDRR